MPNFIDISYQRSYVMSRIKGTNTKPEILLRKVLWSKGHRYRINFKILTITPDIVFPNYKLIIFVDGSFWHGYNWVDKKNRIKSNREYWINKIERNMERDREQTVKLKSQGWLVLRFWDHEIIKNPNKCVTEIEKYMKLCR